jgi:hypothetical protein
LTALQLFHSGRISPPAANSALEREVEEHYRAHDSKASKMGAADVAAEYQRIKAEAAGKTSKTTSELEALAAQLQVRRRGGKAGGQSARGSRLRLPARPARSPASYRPWRRSCG